MNHQNYSYKLYGLNISSEFELNGLVPGNGASPDVHISSGTIPDHIDNYKIRGLRYQAKPGHFFLKVDKIAKFLVKDGKQIIVDAKPTTTEQEINLFLLGSTMGALLQQRQLLTLHGSAIIYNGHAVIFSGVSGVGKSTLASAFAKKGCKIIADDISVVQLKNGNPYILPASPFLKLWEDSIEKIGEKPKDLSYIRKGLRKYRFPVIKNFSNEIIPIGRIYILNTKNNTAIEIRELEKRHKLAALINNTYRKKFLNGLSDKSFHFQYCQKIALSIPIKVVTRSRGGFLLNELTELIEQDLKL